MTLPGLSPIGREVLDDPAADPQLVKTMLMDIARSNHWFGGRWALRYGLRALVGKADRGRTMTLLDIGTGAGDLPEVAEEWCRRRGIELNSFGVERIHAAARLAKGHGMHTVVGCGTRPPFGNESVDIVLLSQVIHHLDDSAALEMIDAAVRMVRRGVIIADLRPSRPATIAYRVAGAVMGLDPLTIDDGITSLARGRDKHSMAILLAKAEVTGARLTELPFARIVASWRVEH